MVRKDLQKYISYPRNDKVDVFNALDKKFSKSKNRKSDFDRTNIFYTKNMSPYEKNEINSDLKKKEKTKNEENVKNI